MIFNKFETNGYCVGGRHISATKKNIYGSITSKVNKVLIGFCSICNRKESMTVTDKAIKAEGLGDFFKNLGKKDQMYKKRWQKTFYPIQQEP